MLCVLSIGVVCVLIVWFHVVFVVLCHAIMLVVCVLCLLGSRFCVLLNFCLVYVCVVIC